MKMTKLQECISWLKHEREICHCDTIDSPGQCSKCDRRTLIIRILERLKVEKLANILESLEEMGELIIIDTSQSFPYVNRNTFNNLAIAIIEELLKETPND